MKSKKSQLIGITDVAKKIPMLVNKGPKMLKGLLIANNKNETKNVGLGWAFNQALKSNPSGAAILYEDRTISYQLLDAWSSRIANYLLSRDIRKGDVVAVFIENRPELLALAIACAKVGAVLALVNSAQTGKVLTHSIRLVEAKLVVVGAELASELHEIVDTLEVTKDDILWWADADTLIETGEADYGFTNFAEQINRNSAVCPQSARFIFKDDGLFYIFTSGTTGMPKAVIFSHGRWMKAYGTFGHIMDLDSDDIMYVTLPLYHATGIAVCWSSVIKGAGAIAMRRKFSSSNFWSDVHKFNASSFGYVGELCRYLLDTPASELEKTHRVTKMIGNGLRPSIWAEFKQRFNIKEVYEFYASSEGNIGFSNIFNFENTVGFSPMEYDIIKYDKEKNQPVKDERGYCVRSELGEPGLLIGKITDKTPFDGYTDPEKTKDVIMENVFGSGDRFFNTGDLMRNIGFKHAQFVDRLGDTFRWKGENVSTTEVESIMADQDLISEAIVYGVEVTGTNGRAGMAAITLADGSKCDDSSLKELFDSLKVELPAYAVPLFLRIQKQVERTGTFKYSKNKLKEEGFDPSKCSERLIFANPNGEFADIDAKVFDAIESGEYRL